MSEGAARQGRVASRGASPKNKKASLELAFESETNGCCAEPIRYSGGVTLSFGGHYILYRKYYNEEVKKLGI